jgi:Ca-activated chloride channel family protein
LYILWEYVFCVFLAAMLVGFLGAAGALGYLLKAAGMTLIRTLRTAMLRPAMHEVPRRLSPARARMVWQRGRSVMGMRSVSTGLAGPLLAFVTLTMLPAASLAQQAEPPPPQPDAPYTIAVSVDEVLLHATVRRRRGPPVAGLDRDAFQIFEDGVPQQIRHFSHAEVPATVGLVIDNSGSMITRRAEVIAAALAFAESSNPYDQIFLVNFNERVRFGLPSGVPFTDDRAQLRDAMKSVTADGMTALYDAVVVALQHLTLADRDKKVLIVISDGADNASNHTEEQMLALAARSGAIIYGLGIYEPGDPENRRPRAALRALAEVSGGEAFFPQSLREVLPLCERIAREIRSQYALSYIPTNQHLDGTYRTIEVRAATPGGRALSVTTRLGYTAPRKPARTKAAEPEAQD